MLNLRNSEIGVKGTATTKRKDHFKFIYSQMEFGLNDLTVVYLACMYSSVLSINSVTLTKTSACHYLVYLTVSESSK